MRFLLPYVAMSLRDYFLGDEVYFIEQYFLF